MITLEDHGLGGSGNTFTKFAKVTASLIAPLNPQKYDIWLKTDKLIGDIYFNESDTTSANNDIFIKTTDKQTIFKPSIDKGKNHIDMPVPTTTKPKIVETNYFDVHGSLYNVKYNQNSQKELIEAFYWEGTKWVQFSFSNNFFLLRTRSTSNSSIFYHEIYRTIDMTPISTTSEMNAFLSFDMERNRLFTYQSSTSVNEYDFTLNLSNTITRNYSTGSGNNIFEKGGRYYETNISSGVLTIYDKNDNNKVVYTLSGFDSTYRDDGVFITKDKKYLCIRQHMNGGLDRKYTILDINNMQSIVKKGTTTNVGRTCYTIGVLDDKVITPYDNSGYITLYEKSRDMLTTLKTINTALPRLSTSDQTRDFLGADNLGNYYFARVVGTSPSYSMIIEKVDANGSTVYTKTHSTTISSIIMTKNYQILMIKKDSELCVIDRETGNIAQTISVPSGRIFNNLYNLDEWRV